MPPPASSERVFVPALRDGFRLAVSVFRPPNEGGMGSRNEAPPAIVIAQATGVPGRFYNSIAAYLASTGSPTITFDLRCCGASFPPSATADPAAVNPVEGSSLGPDRTTLLKAYPHVGFDQWGTRDYAAVLLWAWASLCGHGRERELVLMGNSLGGHLVPLALRGAIAAHTASKASTPPPRVRRALFIGSTSPYFGYWPEPESAFASQQGMLENMRQEGFMDCTSIGFGNDIPLRGGEDWLTASAHPNYTAALPEFREHFVPYCTDTLSISFSDDHLAHGSPRKVDAFLRTLGYPDSVESAEEKEWWESGGDASGATAHAALSKGLPPPFFLSADSAHAQRKASGWLNTRVMVDVVHQGWVQGSPLRGSGDVPSREVDTRPRAVGHTDWARRQVGAVESPSSEVWELIRAFCQNGFVPSAEDALLGGIGGRRDFGAPENGQVSTAQAPVKSAALIARL